MTAREWALAYLFAIHWVYVLAIASYLWWGSPRYDRIYLFIMGLTILHWLLLGDCFIAKLERGALGRAAERYLSPSIQFYQGPTPLTVGVSVVLNALYGITMVVVLLRQGYPKAVAWTVAALFAFYIGHYRYEQYKAAKRDIEAS